MKGSINMENTIHVFEKTNQVTLRKGGDNYQCLVCGIKGHRPNFSPTLNVNRAPKKLFYNCNGRKSAEPKKYGVAYELIRDINVYGSGNAKAGDILYSCECPEDYKDRFDGDIWLMGSEPFRVFSEEIKKVQKHEK